MKSTRFVALALAVLAFISCNKEEGPQKEQEETFAVALTKANISVDGLSQDYSVIIDNAGKTVDVVVDYMDKAELSALKVGVKGLPEGVTSDIKAPFDYTKGNQTVKFTNGKAEVEFVFSASAGKPEPHFLMASVGGVAVANGVAKHASTVDLRAIEFEFAVAPEGTKVYTSVEGEEVELESGALIDFTDKLNGVDFTLKCEDAEVTENIKVVTSGISKVKRVWGHYTTPSTVEDTWFEDHFPAAEEATENKLNDGLNHSFRNIAMDDQYVYIAASKGKNWIKECVYAVEIANSDNVKALSTEGFNTNCHFLISGLEKIKDGDKTYILACSMARLADQHLMVYKYDGPDSAPAVVLDYTLPSAIRLGDKFTVVGDWQNGALLFSEYSACTSVYRFNITNGRASSTPEVISLDNKMGPIGSFYQYSESEYLWCGTGHIASVFELDRTTAEMTYTAASTSFSYPMCGAGFFEFKEEKYMAYNKLINSYMDGQFRILALTGDTLAESIENADVTRDKIFKMGDPDEEISAKQTNGNGTSDLCIHQVGDDLYIAAIITNVGVSLFKVE